MSTVSGDWSRWAEGQAAEIRAAQRWREPRDFDGAGPVGTVGSDATPVVSFASNDYLGLTQHPAVVAAAHDALDRWGAGSGSARLIVGSRPVHGELERALAQWKGTERAVLFPTGFAANLGVLTTFGARDVLVCSDELNHASIIDGCRLSHATRRGVPARRPRAPRLVAVAPRRAGARSSSPTPSSRWTATAPTSTALVPARGPPRCPARARRGPRGARSGAGQGSRRRRRRAGGHALEDAGITGRLRRHLGAGSRS